MNSQPNTILSIALPTYNRANFLEHSLAVHIPLLKHHNIQIFVSDNASTDETSRVVEKWQRTYPFLHYKKNMQNLGPDLNFQSALELPDTEYTWLLGDTSKIRAHDIETVLNTLTKKEKYDALIVNLLHKVTLPTCDYRDANQLLEDLGGLMSCMSCLIYSKSMIKSANFSLYYNSNFLQTGILFESIAKRPFLVHWIQPVSINSLERKDLSKNSWAHTRNIFKIGLEGWTNFVLSLPTNYSLKSKLKACTSFGEVSGAFTIKGMISLRSRGLLDYKTFREYQDILSISLNYPAWFVAAISLTPRPLLSFLINLYFIRKKHTPPESNH
ncbi:glycosyltransferase [Pseudomonas nabeulensis]|uniref:Glycosyltransferase n=1 Tax=Pseudomonas nabeulensis TaxID=2293833 RepID=A0A4Z0AZZ5_9PSED|nr:glycosyltransferase family 2 protein [Pseudomonas nabeulensis]TFY92295.1 glycosyltransferase [Pseudomonas nabeulensis]